MDEQWQPPWQYAWEERPAEPAAAPPPTPPPTPWEPELTPPRRHPPRAARIAVLLGGAMVLGGLLATCGPLAAEDTGELVGGSATDGPAPAPLAPPPPSVPVADPVLVERVGAPAGPSAARTPGPSPSASASASASARSSPAARPTPSAHRSPSGGAGTRPKPSPSLPLLSGLGVCTQAERLGQWQPGSEQARACHDLYGG
ncbi:hypothetical protein [Kitasatospora sp. NPDC088346]|uniref:hypothetical protein n=1 Tax=Kitasatospora sp. NPDC088346 TaxID=3364073 RepID=UPI0037F5A0D3